MMRLAILPFVLSAFLIAQPSFMNDYKAGLEALKQGDYRTAIQQLEQAIADHPESSESVRTYGVQFEPYHPYTYLAEAYFWLDEPNSYQNADRYIQLAFHYGENDRKRFPALGNKPQQLRNLLKLVLDEKDQPPVKVVPLDEVNRLLQASRFGDALKEVEQLLLEHPDDTVLRSWQVILNELVAKTEQAELVEMNRKADLEAYLQSARRHVLDGNSQEAYRGFLLVNELDPGNQEAAAFIDAYTRELELQGKTQEEIQLELKTYASENRDLIDQLTRQERENRTIQTELGRLKKKIKDLQTQNESPEPGLNVTWNLRPVPDKEQAYNISAAIQSKTPLKTLSLFINGIRIQSWDLAGDTYFKIPTIQDFTFLQLENLIRVEAIDQKDQRTFDAMTLNIPKIRNPLADMAPKVLLFLALFSASYYYLASQRRKRLAFRERFNPYIAGAPVFTDQMFFGRNDLVKQMINTLHNNSMMICGERRIGKTSFLHRLYQLLPKVDDPDYCFYPVMIDLQGVEEAHFFTYLDHEIIETLNENNLIELDPPQESLDVREFTSRLRKIVNQLKQKTTRSPKIVLLLDEVDVMNRFSERTNQQLRSVFMKGFARHLAAVMAGIHINKRWDSEGSPWYNFFEQIDLEPFTERHAKALIELPVKGIYSFSDEAISRILEVSNLKPYMIQRICVNLVAHILTENRRRISRADVDQIYTSLMKEKGE